MKHQLIVLVGMSPAVITETVYALCKKGKRPDDVIAITTEKGRQEIKTQLFDSGVWKKMLEDLQLSGQIKFGNSDNSIKVIPANNSENNSVDIKNTHDNKEFADYMLDVLRSSTENPEVKEISFSIAGGRKSMSAVGALVMSLLGRKNDHLYHILVQPPYDNPQLNPKFYYPQPGVIHCLGTDEVKSCDADLQLGEIPFVKCRYWFEEKNIALNGYSSMVENINQSRIKISINTQSNELRINEQIIRLNYLEFVIYWMFAEKYKSGVREKISKENFDECIRRFLQQKGIKTDDEGDRLKRNNNAEIVWESDLKKLDLPKKLNRIKEKIKAIDSLSDEDIDAASLTASHRRKSYGFLPSLVNKSDIEII